MRSVLLADFHDDVNRFFAQLRQVAKVRRATIGRDALRGDGGATLIATEHKL